MNAKEENLLGQKLLDFFRHFESPFGHTDNHTYVQNFRPCGVREEIVTSVEVRTDRRIHT